MLLVALLALTSACSLILHPLVSQEVDADVGGDIGDPDAGGDGDGDSDADADEYTRTDGNADIDGDEDLDADSGWDVDSDLDADSDWDVDSDLDSTVDVEVESDGDECVPDPPELCNGLDDDCDGMIDNGACAPCTLSRRGTEVYLFCLDFVDWDTARSACTSWGYDLVVIEDSEENGWLWTIGEPLFSDEYWIGLNDRDAEDTFLWVDGSCARDSGADVAYTNWVADAPDNSGEEDCVELDRGYAGQWQDVPCSQAQGYICELSPP